MDPVQSDLKLLGIVPDTANLYNIHTQPLQVRHNPRCDVTIRVTADWMLDCWRGPFKEATGIDGLNGFSMLDKKVL